MDYPRGCARRRNYGNRGVSAGDERDRLWRSIPSLDASLVRNRPTLNTLGLLESVFVAVRWPSGRGFGPLPANRDARNGLLGWGFGIRPRFRRQGFGTRAMYLLWDFARSIECKELWVYTGSSDDIAVCFYKSLGFEVLGAAAQWARGQTMDDLDIILRRFL